MAVAYYWPSTLPQRPQLDSFSETNGVLVIRSPMDSGPAKMRRRAARPRTMQVSFFMDAAQRATLDNFIENTIRGTARFGFTHPIKQIVEEVRIVPQQDGLMYTSQPITYNWFSVQMQFEVLP
jgi:hypothetical protein